MTRIKFILSFCLITFLAFFTSAQNLKGYSKDQVQTLSSKVEDQIRFLEFLLNTLGNKETSARDKDVIIRESYLKIFRDEKVQVEDDLLQDRKVVTNKDVTAYLKDIEFFYKNVEFKFKVREIKPAQKDNGQVYFVASLDRTIEAQGMRGEKISNTKPRFVEVNLDEKSQELKIVSIYTTKVSRDEELTAWWKSLSPAWVSFFKQKFSLNPSDSVGLEWFYKFVSIDTLNISGNTGIRTLAPLSELRDLKVIDISNTQIRDLGPISNVTFLENLDISHTPTRNIKFIKYSDRLKALNISHTQVDSIQELLNLKSLISLKADQTPISSFSVLNQFKNLEELSLRESGFNNPENIQELKGLKSLDLSRNYMVNLSSLAGFKEMVNLNLSQTNIQDLSPLKEFENLEFLDVTATPVSDLTPLHGLSKLRKVLADETQLSNLAADNFVRQNPDVLLIHHVKDLESWWSTLSDPWKAALKRANPAITNDSPGVETLTKTVTVSHLDLSGLGVETLNPLVKFVNLQTVDFSDNPIMELLPLTEVKTLKKVTGKNTQVTDASTLKTLENLELLNLEGSPVKSISELVGLEKLKLINVNRSSVELKEIPDFLIRRPDVNVIFRTDELQTWWANLASEWKDLFRRQNSLTDSPSEEELHSLTAKSELVFDRIQVADLAPLPTFINLRSLQIFDAPISSISPLSGMVLLTKLRLSQVPVIDFMPISGLLSMVSLDISNTGIEDLSPISNLTNLKYLNISGTNLKNLKGLETLAALEELDVASTNLRSLKPIEDLNNLKKLSCFNTRLTSRAVDSFKSSHPDCEVRFY
ncbi:leucine-rich repeat domain-containing protein [Algoriphagus mannitolivorans]|uniref:leucine-rich repeat domain-containing protein n=1 Tax=Algoriphagus mannitolivorans TaxID=226504 RepID=UPI0004170302|nr:leucine-rich repeat domain-containing protein [Algoriphagus mannitolivorans]